MVGSSTQVALLVSDQRNPPTIRIREQLINSGEELVRRRAEEVIRRSGADHQPSRDALGRTHQRFGQRCFDADHIPFENPCHGRTNHRVHHPPTCIQLVPAIR